MESGARYESVCGERVLTLLIPDSGEQTEFYHNNSTVINVCQISFCRKLATAVMKLMKLQALCCR